MKFKKLLGDKGYDAEHNHVLAREELGIKESVIAVKRNTNGTRQWPKSKYRRALKKKFPKKIYGQRWQVGVSRKGRINPVGESPTVVRGSSHVAWEAA